MRFPSRASRWTVPVAAIALLAGLAGPSARAADDAPPAAGKATIAVTVVDQDGKPVADAMVNLLPPRQRHHKQQAAAGGPAVPMQSTQPSGKPDRPKPLQTTRTDADGKATLRDVADGTYTVAARLKGTGRGHEKVTVADGKDQSVSITLKL